MPRTTNIWKTFILLWCVAVSFHLFAQNRILNTGWQYSKDKAHWETVNLPHTWNKDDAFDDEPGYRRGFGHYKKQVFIASEESNRSHYLKFNAVNQEATVFVNGKLMANHKGGYTAFSMDVTTVLKFGDYNLIEVMVDNTHNVDIPPLDADFTFWGGISRDVEWISVPKQHFSLSDFASDGFYVNYYDVSQEKAGVEVAVLLDNLDVSDADTVLKLELLDAEGNHVKSRTENFNLPSGSSNKYKIKLPLVYNPKLWSPDSPYLYKLKLTLSNKEGKILETKQSNVGFRWVSVDPDKGFFLNGKPIKLIGVNRHQDYEGYGNAVPLELQEKDIELIKNMGANVIRFAHYPHTRELYDLCDQLGILVWTEIPIVNRVTDSEAFFNVCMNMQNEHIKQYYNHPSVVMFGYMNEIFLRLAFDKNASESDKTKLKEATVKLAKQLEGLTRELAPNHITVMACHLNEVYNETGIADLPMLLGWNLYFGWYDGQIEGLGPFLDNQHERYPNRSLFLSEYGPGADVRIFTKTPLKFDFSTEYQAKLHQSYYKQITSRPFMAGMTAWNFADFGSEFRGDAIPHVNQKGLVQYDRTPKEIYYWYKSVLDTKTPFVHVASNFYKELTLFGEETFPLQVFSNQESVSVFLNDEKIDDFTVENGVVMVEFPFKNGTNKIKVVSENALEEKTIQVRKLTALDFKTFDRLGINVGSHFYFVDSEHNTTFVPDQSYQQGFYGYMNGQVLNARKENHQGIPYNIKNTTSDPLFQTMLEGCTSYKVNIPKGQYRVRLFFVEPQIKPVENVYNLTNPSTETENKKQRIFDVYLNEQLIQKNVNLAAEYPEKYGVILAAIINIEGQEGLTVILKPIEGEPVISGILIEKIN